MIQHGPVLLITIAAIILGSTLALVARTAAPDDRIVIGNTGGTLTTVIEIDSHRILVGAGPSRSHSADLLGRTTRPWDREVDLLILSGWDDHHAPGALGLLERRSVNGIAVVGLPGEEPIWTLLEREAEAQGLPITYLDRASRLVLGDDVIVDLSGTGSEGNGAWIRLEHQGKRIDIVDTENASHSNPDRSAIASSRQHVMINMRHSRSSNQVDPKLLVLPAPHWQRDFSGISSPYWTEIPRNEHIELVLRKDEIRLLADLVDTNPD